LYARICPCGSFSLKENGKIQPYYTTISDCRHTLGTRMKCAVYAQLPYCSAGCLMLLEILVIYWHFFLMEILEMDWKFA